MASTLTRADFKSAALSVRENVECSTYPHVTHAGRAGPVTAFTKLAWTPHTAADVMWISARGKRMANGSMRGAGVYALASDAGKPEASEKHRNS
jgi:hypothetical protein